MNMRALLLLNGELHLDNWEKVPELTGPWDLVICADGGGRYALELGLRPDVLLGDFDSLSPSQQHRLNPGQTCTFPVAKDATDAELAVCEALVRGADRVVLAGALGGRLDHTLGNIGLLRLLHRRGAMGLATDGRQSVWLVTPRCSPFTIHGTTGQTVSLLPYTTSVGSVSVTGMRWPLQNADLTLGSTRTISNLLLGDTATVSVGTGELLVVVNHPALTAAGT